MKIDMNKEISHRIASLRFFNKGEHHCTRTCKDNVLFMVFEGTLNICEDGVDLSINPGEYHITKEGTFQEGKIPSDMVKYFFVHFSSEFCEDDGIPLDGKYDVDILKPLMNDFDKLYRTKAPMMLQKAKFYEILSMLYKRKREVTLADEIAEFILMEHKKSDFSLDILTKEFNFSKNHIINVFKNKFDMTPFEYLNYVRIREAERLLEITSLNIEEIASECGFDNYSHFFRMFKRINKLSPNKWRYEKRIT